MKFHRFLLVCSLSALIPLRAFGAATSDGPRFEVERDWSGELRPRYRGPQATETAPSPLPVPVPHAPPKVEAPAPVRPRAQASVQVKKEPPRRREERDALAWEEPRWDSDDRRTGPDRAWSERAYAERAYADRQYAERIWREEKRAARERRDRARWQRDQRYDARDNDEVYWDEGCDPNWDRC